MKPWVFELEQKQSDETKRRITYKYSIRCDEKDYSIWERETSRYLEIEDPDRTLLSPKREENSRSRAVAVQTSYTIICTLNTIRVAVLSTLSTEQQQLPRAVPWLIL